MQALSMYEFAIISNKIKKHLLRGRRIKYVDFSFDNRDNVIFCVTFRHWGMVQTVFTVVNRENPPFQSLFDEIIDWLDNV